MNPLEWQSLKMSRYQIRPKTIWSGRRSHMQETSEGNAVLSSVLVASTYPLNIPVSYLGIAGKAASGQMLTVIVPTNAGVFP
jgi:hypothetical protein